MDYKESQKIFNSPATSDIQFILDSQEPIYAHRSVLESRCPYLLRSFDQNGNSMDARGNLVIQSSISRGVLLALMKFIYKNQLDLDLISTPELLQVASKYKLEDLKKTCAQYLMENISVDTVVDILLSAEKHKVNSVKQACVDAICYNFQEVSQTPSFSKLISNPALLLEITQKYGSTPPLPFYVGKRCLLFGISGTVRFIGKTHLDAGRDTWIGLETDNPVGKHDGEVSGVRYFQTKPRHGLLISLHCV